MEILKRPAGQLNLERHMREDKAVKEAMRETPK